MTDVFVDTNVLIYAEESLSAHHAAARACLIRLEAEGAVLWISRQVLREYLAVMTRPSAGAAGIAPLTAAHAIAAIARLLTCNVADFRRYADMIALEPIASAMDA